MSNPFKLFKATIVAVFLTACGPAAVSNEGSPTRALDPQANPVIVMPGMLGSRLEEVSSGELVWGRKRSLGLYPQELEASRRMAVPFLTTAKAPAQDDIRAVAILDQVRPNIFGIRLKREIYSPLVNGLKADGYNFAAEDTGAPRGYQFPFDWRRDSVEAAVFFGQFIAEKKAQVQAERAARFGDAAEPVKFDIVSHSLGGLILRYYMMYGGNYLEDGGAPPPLTWMGAQDIEKVIYIAPPHGGSAKSLTALLNGRAFGFRQPVFDQVIMSTYLTTFQLLPRRGHTVLRRKGEQVAIDIYDPYEWRRNKLGPFALPMIKRLRNLTPDASSDEERYEIMFTHVSAALRYAEAFHNAIDATDPPPPHLRSFLITGDAEDTATVLTLFPSTSLVETEENANGDSSVTEESAWFGACRETGNACWVTYEDTFSDRAEHLIVVQTAPVAAKIREWLAKPAHSLEN